MRAFDADDSNGHDAYMCFTGKARLSRDMHLLEGYVYGIAADGRVNDAELKNLTRWLSEHREFSDRHPFNEVIPRIQTIVTERICGDEERADLLWVLHKFTTDNGYYDDITSDMQRLQGILAGILSDGVITEKELRTLEVWIAERSYLKRCWPYDELDRIIKYVMQDGRIDPQEHEALVQFFGEFVATGERKAVGVLDPDCTVSGVCIMSPQIEFNAKCFCFTGSSTRGTRDHLAAVIVQLGGIFHRSLRNDTDFLIVGADGNPCWAFACYGRKVEDAIERRRNGQHISVVHERDFWTVADNLLVRTELSECSKCQGIEESAVAHKRSNEKKSRKSHSAENETKLSAGTVLAGKTLVVTGTLAKYKREEIEALIVQHGGRAASSVSKNTAYLVAGEKAGSKLDKAQQLGVPVITEADFDRLIGNA